MASASQKATHSADDSVPIHRHAVSADVVVVDNWRDNDQKTPVKSSAMVSLINQTDPSTKGILILTRAQTSHPLDPLSAAEIKVAVATVRAAGATPEVRDGMRFVEAVLSEPDKSVVALADAYFFPPFNLLYYPEAKLEL